MRRRRLTILALAATIVVGACDTDDGREMQTPDSMTRYRLSQTTTSTSTTTTTVPPLVIPETSTTSTTSTSSSTTSTSSSPATSSTTDTAQLGASTSTVPTGSDSAGATQLQFAGPWDDGAPIPVEFTCDGTSDVPLITWTAPPDGTGELALSVLDPDANGFVHWLIIGLPAEAGSVGGGEPLVAGAAEATNSFGDQGWGGPCPPPGASPHTYVFTLHLLDQQIELPPETPTNELLTAVDAATASTATFTGTYERA